MDTERPRAGSGRCVIPECGKRIDPAYLMCAAHWRAVPNAIQRRVYLALNRYSNCPGSQAALDNLRAKQREAVESITGATAVHEAHA